MFTNLKTSRRLQAVVATGIVVAIVATFIIMRGGGDSDLSFVPRGDADEVLAVTDPKGSPHFVLTEDFDPSSNADKKVPKKFESDDSKVLDVAKAAFVDGGGPYALQWEIKNGDDTVKCINCIFLDKRVKEIIAAAIEAGILDDVEEIVGLDPSRTLAGDYAGNGWQVEFVVGNSAQGVAAGEEIAAWLLENSKANKVLGVQWKNIRYFADTCDTDLSGTTPSELYPTSIPADELSQRNAAMDRVIAQSPSYVPQFEDRDGAQFVTGWKATSCS